MVLVISSGMVQLAIVLATASVSVVLALLLAIIPRYRAGARSPLNALRGPKPTSLLQGNFGGMTETGSARMMEERIEEHGNTFVVHGLLGERRLFTVDLKALSHILHNGDVFQRSNFSLRRFTHLFGKGLLSTEGPTHRRQRKIILPAFGTAQIRKFTETFVNKANTLRDIWMELARQSTRKDKRARVDAFEWVTKAALDIIGLTGFNYDFVSLRAGSPDEDELYSVINTLVNTKPSVLRIAQFSIPALRFLPFGPMRDNAQHIRTIQQKGAQIMLERKTAVLAEAAGAAVDKASFGHDLLSLCMKANLAADLPASQRMSDEEIRGQIPSFLLAEHETTSTAVAWALFALACHQDVQAQLRAELVEFPHETPSMEELGALPVLDRVVREVLRLYSPIPAAQRQVAADTVVPLDTPVVDKHGVRRTEVALAKGDTVVIPIRLVNRSVAIWGADAHEFRPERWAAVPEAARGVPSIYSNLQTFNAGPHACPGYRFSIVEVKALLFAIFRSFKVELAIQPDDIVRREGPAGGVGRPSLAAHAYARYQLPILIRPLSS